ncbi:MAG: hypothetical protein UMR38_06230 [Candidatus Izemoplasma sp.]|nr:hypothetical protein [Candidatus Izemoplasma sp.]
MFKSPKQLTRFILFSYFFTVFSLWIITEFATTSVVAAIVVIIILLVDGIVKFVMMITSMIHLVQFVFQIKHGRFMRRLMNVVLSVVLFVGTFLIVLFVVLGSLIIILPFTA